VVLYLSFKGSLKQATASSSTIDKYYINILVDEEKELPEKQENSSSKN